MYDKDADPYAANSRNPLLRVTLLTCILMAGCATTKALQTTGNHAATNPGVPTTPSTTAASSLALRLCKTVVANPPANDNGLVRRLSATGCLNGIALDVAPAIDACLTSGYGPRPPGSRRLHKGVDYQSKPAAGVVAAAPGKVVEFGFRQKDLGHWIVIDHGSGVYTSYAHLKNTAPDLSMGARVKRGQDLGIMGMSGDLARSVHLHYEVRQGNLDTARSYFLLQPVDPFSLPGECPVNS